MNKPKGILLDFGDTILDMKKFNTLDGNTHCMQFLNNPEKYSPEQVQETANAISESIKPLREESMLEHSFLCFQNLLNDHMEFSSKIPDFDLELEFWKACAHFVPEPHIIQALDFLKAAGIKTGIVSNSAFSGKVLEWELDKHKLLPYFDFIMSSADYGIRKPHPMLFSTAVHLMNETFEDVWFIGDKLEYDITGALNVGLFAIWYNKNHEPKGDIVPDVVIHNWKEFLDLLSSAE